MEKGLYPAAAIISLLLSFLLSGCGSVSIRDNLVASPAIFSDFKAADKMLNLSPNLEAAYWQIKLGDATLKKEVNAKKLSEPNPLPESFSRSSLISKMIISIRDAHLSGDGQALKVSRNDIKELLEMIGENFGINLINKDHTKATKLKKDSTNVIYKTVQSYLCEYFFDEDGFIDREGVRYAAPEFKGKVENSTITAIVGILWEAIADGLLGTPVWYKTDSDKPDKENRVYLTKDRRRPTASKKGRAEDRRVVDIGHEGGIDEYEVKVIRYVSSLAAEQSKLLSGSVYRSLGKLNIGFAVEGGYSFGDNETLAKILDTTFEVVAKRSVLEASRQILERVSYSSEEDFKNKRGWFISSLRTKDESIDKDAMKELLNALQ